jgi:hypothetical protein
MNVLTILKKIWYWSYERETWQYDVMCVAILAFIFLIPASVFDDPESRARWNGRLQETVVPADRVRDGSIGSLSAALAGAEIHRVEILRTPDGRVEGYKVWSRSAE